jgi:pimeloyl-ACP methyl ester carboxylesterase
LPDKVVQEWAQIQGAQVCFRNAGRGPALVLVHGLLGYSFSWRFAIPLLSDGREVFAPDMPGSGFSDCGLHDCRLGAAADRLLAFMDAVGISSCDLVGSSYGGATAIMAAAIAPAKFRSLILVSPANPWSRNGRRRLALLKNPLASAIFPGMARPLRWMHAYFHRRMYGDARRIAADTIGGYRRALARRGVFEHAVGIVQSWSADMQELQAALPKIAHLPTLIVWGSRDRVVDPASAEFLRLHLPHAEVAVMKGAGHLPYEECPEEFCRIALDFLNRHNPVVSLSRQANPTIGPRREVT